jgi:hypothetical protein
MSGAQEGRCGKEGTSETEKHVVPNKFKFISEQQPHFLVDRLTKDRALPYAHLAAGKQHRINRIARCNHLLMHSGHAP